MPTATQSIREIVATHASAATVLQRFDIDLCSQGNASLDRACADLQLSVDQVLEKLLDAETGEPGAAPADPTILSMGRLIQHIVRVHHQYVRQELPRLAGMSHKLAGKHGERAPELKRVEALLEELHAEMFAHIEKEEQILFPFIAQMEQNINVASAQAGACFRSLAQPISMMVREHESAGGIVERLRQLTGGFEAPAWACATHAAFYAGLLGFETDLKQHVHLENDHLFPRAVEMEAALNKRG